MSLYEEYLSKIEEFERSGLNVEVFGKSVEARKLYAVTVGSGNKTIFVQGGMHAREYYTTFLILKLIEKYKNIRCGYRIVFVPLVNPDGMIIAAEKNKPLYKANANMVDLNVNWPARWGSGAANKTYPDEANYIGVNPLSETENYSLFTFFSKIALESQVIYTISYHSKGNEIYWDFFGKGKKHKAFANIVSKSTGYPLKSANKSAGGFKDFVIQNYNIPSATIEIGSNGISYEDIGCELDVIFNRNKNLIYDIIKYDKYCDRRSKKSVKKK